MNTELISLIKKLISFKSETENNEECLNCLNYIKEYLSQYNIIAEINNFNGYYSLFASNLKTDVYDLILSGHIDVVPANESQFQATEKDDFLYGRGTIDMKTQVATMVYCLAHYKGNKSICLAITSDEEIGGFNGTPKIIEKYNLNAKVAFIPDAGYNFQFVNSERGVLQLNITVKGKSVHSAYANLGENAISKAYRIYEKINSMLEQNSPNCQTINLAKISTPNEVYNKVPDICNMLIDIRYNSFSNIQGVYEILKDSPDTSYFIYAKAIFNFFCHI